MQSLDKKFNEVKELSHTKGSEGVKEHNKQAIAVESHRGKNEAHVAQPGKYVPGLRTMCKAQDRKREEGRREKRIEKKHHVD